MTKTSYKYARIIITFFVLAILVMTEVAFNGECPEACEPVGPTGSETTDIIFVVDGSGSIDEVFNLQRQGIWDTVCGPNSVVPSDGSAAIAVIQFSSVQETCVEIPLTVINTSNKNDFCACISGIQQRGGSTYLHVALSEAESIFQADAAGADRYVIVSSDGNDADTISALAEAEDLRTASPHPVKICAVHVGVDCANPLYDDFMKALANSEGQCPSQPVGEYVCMESTDQYATLCEQCISCEAAHAGEPDCYGDGIPLVCNPDADCDSDGINNANDNCPLDYNPGQEDVGEINAGNSADDVGDLCDNCPSIHNPVQEDLDDDSTGCSCYGQPSCNCGGDACDSDLDGDGVGNSVDNCPFISNPGQEDVDGDGVGNVCDQTPASVFDFNLDGDVDQDDFSHYQECYTGSSGGVTAGCENIDVTGDNDVDYNDYRLFERCASGPAILADSLCGDCDANGIHDASEGDGDWDVDGISVVGRPLCTGSPPIQCDDNCPCTYNPNQTDSDGDGLGDACDP